MTSGAGANTCSITLVFIDVSPRGPGVSGGDIFIARGTTTISAEVITWWSAHTGVWVASALTSDDHISGRNFVVFIEKQCLIRRVFCFHLSGRSFCCDLWRANVGGVTRLVRRGHKSWNENLLMCIILQIMWKLHRKIIINTTLWTRCIRSQAQQKLKVSLALHWANEEGKTWFAFPQDTSFDRSLTSPILLKLFNFPWPPYNFRPIHTSSVGQFTVGSPDTFLRGLHYRDHNETYKAANGPRPLGSPPVAPSLIKIILGGFWQIRFFHRIFFVN